MTPEKPKGTTWNHRKAGRIARVAVGVVATVATIGGIASISGSSGAATRKPVVVESEFVQQDSGFTAQMSTGWGD